MFLWIAVRIFAIFFLQREQQRSPYHFIEFVDDEAAAMAQEKADGMELAGKKLTVKFADGERKSAGQMKGQKESCKLKIELDRLKKMQEEQRGRILYEIEKARDLENNFILFFMFGSNFI